MICGDSHEISTLISFPFFHCITSFLFRLSTQWTTANHFRYLAPQDCSRSIHKSTETVYFVLLWFCFKQQVNCMFVLCIVLNFFWFFFWLITCNFNGTDCTKLKHFKTVSNRFRRLIRKMRFVFGISIKKTTHARVRYKQQFSSCTQSKRYYPTRRLN